MSAASLRVHLEKQHSKFSAYTLDEEFLERRPPQIYRAHFSAGRAALGRAPYCCPVPGCAGEGSTRSNLRRHFRDRHPLDLVEVGADGAFLFPKCTTCGLQISCEPRYQTRHMRSEHCRE